jgi:hypothetical protein
MAARQRIGVLTFHKSINYGSYWQARCLVEGLRARGHDAELLDHDCSSVRLAEARCALQPELPHRTARQMLPRYAAKVRRFRGAFAKLPLSRPFSLHRPQAADRYDSIVVGSDEVWNFRHPWYGSKPIFFGDGLSTGRLVSYAASFGNHSAWDGIHPDWARKLTRFSGLSVRDENSWHLVRGGTGEEPALVLDPCLQFADVVRAHAPPNDEDASKGAVIVYGHGFPLWLQRLARGWADRRGLRLVSVGYVNPWADEQQIALGPLEFAHAMAGASAIITNFFHGCVFAMLNGKPWLTSPSDYRSIKIPDLANLLGAGRRVIDEQSSGRAEELLETPLQPQVATRLHELRARSRDYLDAALS